MANELVHGTVGTVITQGEFEAVGLHVCNSQATGDLIYASSATQLSRLAIGAADTILTCNGTLPSWSATPILNTAVAKGVWTASGTWTLPAITLGGDISAATYSIGNLDSITGRTTTVMRVWAAAVGGANNRAFDVIVRNAAGSGWLDSIVCTGYTNTPEVNIAPAVTYKIGLYGIAATAQQTHITDPGDLATALTAIAAINVRLETIGIIATV